MSPRSRGYPARGRTNCDRCSCLKKVLRTLCLRKNETVEELRRAIESKFSKRAVISPKGIENHQPLPKGEAVRFKHARKI